MAELLVLFAVIAFLVVVVLPTCINNIYGKVRAARVSNIMQKYSKSSDKMLSVVGMSGYVSTEDYVRELQNHLSIITVCENDNLRACWPTEKVIIDDKGTEWEIAKTKTGRTLKMEDQDGVSKWDETVGIITADGISMILSYNVLCDINNQQSPMWRSSDKSESTRCIAGVFDWNGKTRPNKFGAIESSNGMGSPDVLPFNALGLGDVCAMELSDGKCLSELRAIDGYITKDECLELVQKGYGLNKSNCYSYDKNYWGWAVRECGGVDNMASMADLAEVASKLYGKKVASYGDIESSKVKYDSSMAVSVGFPQTTDFWVWSGIEKDQWSVHGRSFKDKSSYWIYNYRNASSGYFACKTSK